MKDLFGWFCVGFAIFFVAGGIVGRLNRVPPDEAIDLVAVHHTAVTLKHPDEGIDLTYVCRAHDYFDYNLSDGSLIPDRNLLDHPIILKPLSLENFETIFVAATGWELRGVVGEATGMVLTTREKVAMVLGSVTGFYAGRWLFSTRLPRCDSEEVLSRLQRVEYWDKLKRQKCKQECLMYRLRFSTTDDQPLVLYIDALRKAAHTVSDYNSRHFIVDRLDMLQQIFRDSSSSDAKLTRLYFTRVGVGMPYLLDELQKNPQVLKDAFPSKVPKLAIVINDDPEVIKREVADTTLTMNFGTIDDVQILQGGIWALETIVVCLIAGFLLAVISGWIFLTGQLLLQKNRKRKAALTWPRKRG